LRIAFPCFILGCDHGHLATHRVRPGADPNEPRPGLLFLGFLAAALMVGGVISAVQSTSHT
jgi:hypothetical protein